MNPAHPPLAPSRIRVDLQQVEQAAQSGAPKAMEWVLTFGLIVTLAWVFLEALKLVFRIAMMFGNRD